MARRAWVTGPTASAELVMIMAMMSVAHAATITTHTRTVGPPLGAPGGEPPSGPGGEPPSGPGGEPPSGAVDKTDSEGMLNSSGVQPMYACTWALMGQRRPRAAWCGEDTGLLACSGP